MGQNALKYTEGEMKENDADNDEWNLLETTLNMYKNLTTLVVDKYKSFTGSQPEEDGAVVPKEDNEPLQPEVSEKEDNEPMFDIAKESKMITALETYTDMLSDIHDGLKKGVNPEMLEKELNYVSGKVGEMEPTEAVLQMDQVVVFLKKQIQEIKSAALEEQVEAVKTEQKMEDETNERQEIATIMNELGFPEGKIGDVNDILTQEEEAPENKKIEKKDIASAMTKLGFPEAMIGDVNEILTQEGEAYEINKKEKEAIAGDRDVYRM